VIKKFILVQKKLSLQNEQNTFEWQIILKNLKSIPYTDWCFENKDIIKLIIKTKNLKVHTRLRLKKIFNTKLFFSTYLSN
jgi:hypothetical protein|tara:strand:+ start:911 stop:1150 length:240 start_codon:yes stop_codon:yes gene_type:complete